MSQGILSVASRVSVTVAFLMAVALATSVQAQAAPGFSKSFAPDTIGPGGLSTLTFEIDNSGSSDAATGLTFTDNMPAEIVIADPPDIQNTCSGGGGRGAGSIIAAPGTGLISLSGGQVAGSSSCSIAVKVTSSTVGAHENISGDLTSSAGNSGNATDTLNVVNELPAFSKSFDPASVGFQGTSTLTFTIDNSANSAGRTLLTFTDDLPAGMSVAGPANASTTCVGGLVTAEPGSGSISFRTGTVGAGETCTVTVDVIGGATGTLNNVSGDLTTSNQFGQGLDSSGSATAGLEVLSLGDTFFTKSFTDDPVAPGGTVILRISIQNNDRDNAVSDLAFSDDLDGALSGLTAVGLPLNDICGAGSQVSGTDTILFSGGSLQAGDSCAFDVNLQVPGTSVPGVYTNITSQLSGTSGGVGFSGNAAADDLFVEPAPSLAKNFVEETAAVGDPVTLEFTVTNTSLSSPATAITFVDELTASSEIDGGATGGFLLFPVSVALPPNPNPPCGAGSSLALIGLGEARQGLQLTGGELAAGANCVFSVDVTVSDELPSGTYVNTTEAISGTVGGVTYTGKQASDSLQVVGAPNLSKEFTDDPVNPGDNVTLSFSISHDADSAADATAIAFDDDLDSVLTGLAAVGLPANDICGTGSQIDGTGLLSFTGGTLAPGETCSFDITVAVPLSAAVGSYANTTGNLTATIDGAPYTGNAATDDLGIGGLNLTNEFTDDPVLPGGDVTLEFSISNPSPVDATNIFFFDDITTLPSGSTISGLPLSDICGSGSSLSQSSTSLIFLGGSLASGASCTFAVTVNIPASAASDSYVNGTTSFAGTLDGQNLVFENSSDVLIVDNNLLELAKEFTDDPVDPGAQVNLRFTLDNLHGSEQISDISFDDDLEATLSGLAPSGPLPTDPCGVGSSLAFAAGTLTLSDGNLAGGGNCVFDVTLDVPADVAPGTVATNTTGSVSGLLGGLDVLGNSASDDLEIESPGIADFSKAFDGPVIPGEDVVLTFTITNVGQIGIAGLTFTDDLDAVVSGLASTSGPLSDVCGAGSSISGTSVLSFAGGALPVGDACSFDVTLAVPSGTEAGDYDNVTSNLEDDGEFLHAPATATLTVAEACVIETDYDPVGCSGTFKVYTLSDLDAYYASDFGRDGGSKYMDLKIMSDLTSDNLDIRSPCSISLVDDVELSADFVSLDGRKGVQDNNGYRIVAENACILSETDNAGLGSGSVVTAENLTVQALKTAKIGQNSDVNLTGLLTVISNGDLSASNVIIKSGSNVDAGSLWIEAVKSAHIGQNTTVLVDGAVTVLSTGDFGSSDAGLKSGASVTAGSMSISASREAKIGQDTTVVVTSDLLVESTGNASGSEANVNAGANVDVGGDMDLVSGNKAKIGNSTTVVVDGNLNMNAVAPNKCTVAGSANITAGSTSGNCLE